MKTLWKIKKNSVILVHPRRDDKPHQLSNWVNKLTVKEVTYDQDEMEPHDDWDWLMYWRIFRLPDSSPFDLIAIPMCSLQQKNQPIEDDVRDLQKKIDNMRDIKDSYIRKTAAEWVPNPYNMPWKKSYEKFKDDVDFNKYTTSRYTWDDHYIVKKI